MTGPRPPSLRMHWPIFLSFVWAALGLGLALWVPWLGLAPAWLQGVVNHGVLVVTGFFLLWNLVAAVRVIGRTGRTLAALPLTLVQLVLFTLLFVQIAAHQGAEHYTWDELPRWWDWLSFAAAHGLRAGDLFDVIEAYGLHLQSITHASQLTAVSVIVFHVFMDLFFLSLLFEGVGRLRQALGGGGARALVWLGLLGLTGVWLWSALWYRPWRREDMIWWPVDNLLRVIDFGDALEVYQVHLHAVPRVLWEGTLTAVCRVLFSLILAGMIATVARSISLHYLGGFGLSPRDLEEIARQHRNGATRRKAEERLSEIDAAGVPRVRAGWLALGAGLIAAAGIAVGVHRHDPGWPHPEEAMARLTVAATTRDHPAGDSALAALRRLGPYAAPEIEDLTLGLPDLPRERQLAVLETLGYLGVAAIEPLSRHVAATDAELAMRATAGLRQIGPLAAPALVQALAAGHEPVRQTARAALLEFGARSVQPLIDSLTPENAVTRVALAEELDPYWHLRSSTNVHFQKLVEARPALLVLQDPGSPPEKVLTAARQLHEGGPIGVLGTQALQARLDDPRAEVRTTVAQLLGQMGPKASFAVPSLKQRLFVERDSGVLPAAAEALRQIGGPEVAALVPELITHMLDNPTHGAAIAAANALDRLDKDWRTPRNLAQPIQTLTARLASSTPKGARVHAAEVLGQLGPVAASAVPTLLKGAADEHVEVRKAAKQALEQIDPMWRESEAARQLIPVLIVRLTEADRKVSGGAFGLLEEIDKDWGRSKGALQALPDLLTRVRGEDNKVREAAERILLYRIPDWSKSDAGKQAIRGLARGLESSEPKERLAVAYALRNLAPHVAETVPTLVGVLTDTSPEVRTAALAALEKFGPVEGAALTEVILCLVDPEEKVRFQARGTLARTTPDWGKSDAARRAIVVLVKRYQGKDPKVCAAAEQALNRIDFNWRNNHLKPPGGNP